MRAQLGGWNIGSGERRVELGPVAQAGDRVVGAAQLDAGQTAPGTRLGTASAPVADDDKLDRSGRTTW